MATASNYTVASTLIQPQFFAQQAFFQVLADLALQALAQGASYLEGPSLPKTTGFSEVQIFDTYSPYIAKYGSGDAKKALESGDQVMVALRIETNTRSNQGRGVYDDRLAVIWQKKADHVRAGESQFVKHGADFKMNTEPSAQYESRGQVEVERTIKIRGQDVKRKVKEFTKLVDPDGKDVDLTGKYGNTGVGNDVRGDGRLAAGRLKAGSYKFYNNKGIFLGAAYLVPRESKQPAQRDVNHDGLFTNADTWATPEGELTIDTGDHGMYIHRGGADNTWSAGCQTLPPNEHERLFQILNSRQKDFNYVLVDL